MICAEISQKKNLRRAVLIENKVVINTAVVPLVGLICSSKHEVGRVIDSWLGVAVVLTEASEDEAEVTSGVLWFDRAVDALWSHKQ